MRTPCLPYLEGVDLMCNYAGTEGDIHLFFKLRSNCIKKIRDDCHFGARRRPFPPSDIAGPFWERVFVSDGIGKAHMWWRAHLSGSVTRTHQVGAAKNLGHACLRLLSRFCSVILAQSSNFCGLLLSGTCLLCGLNKSCWRNSGFSCSLRPRTS
jgi:hypothetical protein